MARALYRSVTCNVYTSDPAAQQGSTVREAWANADVLKLNESGDSAVHTVVRGLAGASSYQPGGSVGKNLSIAWRDSVFTRLDSGVYTAYTGGKGDGPSRGVSWVLLKHKATGKRVLEFNMHQIARAFTDRTSRAGTWNSILANVSGEVRRRMSEYDGVPAVISGDMNKGGDINFPNLGEREVTSTPDSYGRNRYDRFFIVGDATARSSRAVTTMSDHKTIVVNIELLEVTANPTTTPVKTKPTPATGTATSDPLAQAPSAVNAETGRRGRTFRRRQEWRYFAMRMDGTGGMGEILHADLPLSDVEIEENLSGHNALSGSISPQYTSLIAPDGRPLLEKWKTAIFAEESGEIRGGGILRDRGFDGPSMKLDCVGYTGYLDEMPYASERFFVETDPASIFRHIWAHVQDQPGGDLGLEVDNMATGLKIGTTLTTVEFTTGAGEDISFEAGPYKLNWYSTHNLADEADKLASENGFDWREKHYWAGNVLRHRLELGYPGLGKRRNDLRFVIGENVHIIPSVDDDGSIYADEVWMLGAGEGTAMKRGIARADIDGLRRVAVIADPSLRSQVAVNSGAARELAWRNKFEEFTEIVVREHPHCDIGSLEVGDEIRVQGPTGWVDVDSWSRVVSRRIHPQQPGKMALTLLRSDKIAS